MSTSSVDLEDDLEEYEDNTLIEELESRGFKVIWEGEEDDEEFFSKEDYAELRNLLDSLDLELGSVLHDIRERIVHL